MWLRTALSRSTGIILILAAGGLYAYQKPFRQYPGIEYDNFPLPADYQQPSEYVFARLMYPQIRGGRGGRVFGAYGDGNWTQGYSMWTQDYPRADRHFLLALRRLTRVNARSVEQPVNLDDGDDVYNWPWLYAVQPGRWLLTDAQCAKLRDYLLRGGFFMADDFWGEDGWEVFMQSMQRVFPDREVVDLDDENPIFHSVFDLSDRYQVPGARYIQTGSTEKCQGCPAEWRGIFDDKGRLMVALTPNSDIGDSWEWADDPQYLERFSALGIRIGVNYIVYAMSH
jgi:hypothetical protein